MVVLSAAVCTKSGKALLARQFVELSKVRIEGLLAAFPKLMGSGKQHTFIETDSVRYIYQPLESLYILLITNKTSNILEDLETLHLLAKLVPEYCHILEEAEITKHAFDLIFAFDEVIAMGYKERVTVQQVKHCTTMESHEEERARVEQQMKELEAKKEADRKRKLLDKKRAEERKLMAESHGSHQPISSSYVEPPQPFVERKEKEPTVSSGPSKPSKGMVLAGKSSRQSALVQVLREEKIVELDEVDTTVDTVPTSSPTPVIPTEGVHVVVEETLVVQVENDGGLQNMEIKGGLSVTVHDANISRVKVGVRQGDNRQFQFKTHPNIDKQAFTAGNVIRLKDTARAFPMAAPAGVLKWRLQTRDEAMLPLMVSCWPSVGPDGQTYVTLEYELMAPFELLHVVISIPVPAPPVVSRVEGDYEYDPRSKALLWKLPIIDQASRQGSLEFTLSQADPKSFFPLQVSFRSPHTFCDLQVVEVASDDDSGVPLKYSEITQLSVEQYTIV
jgi:hypothetical protein